MGRSDRLEKERGGKKEKEEEEKIKKRDRKRWDLKRVM